MSDQLMISIKEAKRVMQKVIASGDTTLPLFLHSSPGVGKSSIVQQICEDQDLELIDIRLASIEASDLCGIPYVRDGEQVWSIPEWFPRDPDSKGILFLDELSNAGINVQQAAYRLILDREVNNNVRLPKGWFCMAAGNLKTDRTGVKGIVPALANRFAIHMNIEANQKDFMAYAMDNNWDTRVMGFIDFKPDYLHNYVNDAQAFPTPRSWEFVNRILKLNLSDGELAVALAGCVGEGVATEFQSFMLFYKDLPSFTRIMEGEIEYTVPKKDLGLLSAITSSLISLFKENHKSEKRMKNLNKIFRQLPDESIILVYKLIQQSEDYDLLVNVSDYTEECYNRVEKHIT